MNNEIHVKIGGDHGGGSFKLSFQICNTKNPNSKSNTVVFSIFEAKDRRSNLKIGTSRFTEQIDRLQSSKFGDQRVRVFLSGDYEFLSSAYGITGANGRHPCLYCIATKEEIQKPVDIRGKFPVRTLETLKENLAKFRDSGGNLKNAKFNYNVIDDPLFNIPIDQASLPGLHISLGCFLKFFTMFEDKCHSVDIALATKMANANQKTQEEEFNKFIALTSEIDLLEKNIEDCDEKIQLINDTIIAAVMRDPNNEDKIKNMYQLRIEHFEAKKIEKPNNFIQMCNILPITVTKLGYNGSDIHADAILHAENFKQLFLHYSKCHKTLNTREVMNQDKIENFGRYII
ncbi:uncharacterized protein LOC130655069 isoform X2 [Hydractinia symbiolongicarpus]|uniref:uncharacterized protein LOC130655069 isoform X2 n=1 Tax=Hydractinia symbiolongicarpus TaxID=13093 RepID=UPI00254F961D|nr:uncharacterized protein LOC130655069 isoform X2 [Hydractinia symbiolongicarpus]